MSCSRCQREVYIPCFDTDDCEELKAVQDVCDHDWEYDLNHEVKTCTYPECGLEKEMSGEEVTERADFESEILNDKPC